jgi:hypothetical protein
MTVGACVVAVGSGAAGGWVVGVAFAWLFAYWLWSGERARVG